MNEQCSLHHHVSCGEFASLHAFHVNELSSPTDVKRADVRLHLPKFMHLQNMFLSIAVVSHKPIVHIQIGGESYSC